jgi:hypothetical protein
MCGVVFFLCGVNVLLGPCTALSRREGIDHWDPQLSQPMQLGGVKNIHTTIGPS